MDSSQRAWVGMSRVETVVVLIQSVAVGLGILRCESRELSLAFWPIKQLYRISRIENLYRGRLCPARLIDPAKF